MICDHPLCENEVTEPFRARLRENTYCSGICRERHTKLLIQKRRREHPEQGPHDKAKLRERKYGLSKKQFDDLYDAQLGRCAICLVALSEVRICVDHDHRSKKRRGLLCNTCNQGLGYFHDDPALLEKAAMYINEHRVRRVRRVPTGR